MQRTKVFGVTAALVGASIAAILLTGGASAAAWHEYKGDMFAGHAYGLTVPQDAENVEFVFEGAELGSASIAVYAPGGAKTGYYELAPSLAKASIANPGQGRYIVYVYDITEGALTVRVASENEPAKLELEEIDLIREETKIGSFEQGKLDQTITADLKKETVFVTLLYAGSSKDLDATVKSAKGAVVTITDETATAFEPGVWTSLKGERVFDAANLDGTSYTVEVHAAQFEGTMVLTTLKLDAKMPSTIPENVAPRPSPASKHHKDANVARPVAPISTDTAQFALEEGVPLAFAVTTATTLVLADTAALDEDEDGNESYEGDNCQPLHGVVAIYAPDDTVLGVFELSHDEPMAKVELPTKGEYVAYASHVEGDPLLAMLEGQTGAVAIRVLAIEEETLDFAVDNLLLGQSYEEAFEIAFVPVEMRASLWDGFGALSSIDIANEKGSVAVADSIVMTPGVEVLQWSGVMRENFAPGTHSLTVRGAYQGSVELTYVYYVRASDVEMDVHADTHDHGTEDPEEPEEPAPAEPPVPIVPPVPPVDELVADVLGL